MSSPFSFIILTYNEEVHLPRLLNSIKGLNAPVFILDSFSTDNTIQIAGAYGTVLKSHAFVNHPQQWDAALNAFEISTPWTIGLDADQIVTPELYRMLESFNPADHSGTSGIYFNRKNYFRGKWIRFGGYYPKYLLKMFRTGIGYSDLNEHMDHRFIAPGKNEVWKNGHLIEENLRENSIGFWIAKHNRYSDLVAIEEIERAGSLRTQAVRPKFFGTPDQRIAWLKNIWWKLPLGWRPFIYFGYRMIYKLGILDGSVGILFHFLQGFWFRMIVDIKIKEIRQQKDQEKPKIR